MYFFSYTRAEKINFQILIKNDFLYNKSVIVKWYKLPFLSFYFSSELNEYIYIYTYLYIFNSTKSTWWKTEKFSIVHFSIISIFSSLILFSSVNQTY